ncbi:translesion DNA synthesis-associated protein ImuA [Variovorax fucosicus]|uniref:translesion DNA synthesis-associated protein ImuA n=1 Tax=Variovorax fucosicus TaxID=3053517 RepID=UPI0025762E9A|nr:translesion DNA synthesis-associated protein ImuA [Variovorax sp. J22G47]MDM0057952.1 translesion DNA synthesis-associated protein ImuA [Variovorax sp. J22G47]
MGLPSLDPFLTSGRHNMWRGDELGGADAQVVGSGHAALDAQLPGGGWPVGAMTEVLQSAPEAHVWQLLLPALAQAVETRGGPVVLIGAPHEPFGPALAAGGLPVEAVMWVRGAPGGGAQRLWACEQALRCADVAAVLAWLPQARVGELRRLQLAAAQHEGLLFVFRPESVAQSASPARLRLQVVSAEAGQMDVHLLKRRGPPLAAPLTLPARNARMTALLAASQLRRKARLQQQGVVLPAAPGGIVVRLDLRRKERHALDRLAVA